MAMSSMMTCWPSRNTSLAINYIAPTLANKEPKNIVPLDIDRQRIKLLKSKYPGAERPALVIPVRGMLSLD